jgi:MFS transporter, ACS family, glucarate transporter
MSRSATRSALAFTAGLDETLVSSAAADAVVIPLRQPRIRWRIFSLLVGFASVLYFQQRSLTIAGERIMPELSLSQMQIGWLEWAFVLTYTVFQFPGGVLGQRAGARRALAVTALLAVIATVAVPIAPALLSGAGLFVVLLSTQLLLGAAQAPFFPICAGVMESWLPARRWGLAQGIHTFGGHVGAALAPPILVFLMQTMGWQRALFWSALPPLGLIAVWVWYGRNTPREHHSVSAAELAELDEVNAPPADGSITWRRILRILVNRDLALFTLSYSGLGYVFFLLSNWSFLYLIQERHFTALEGGWLASLPPIGAALGAGLGGGLADQLCKRFGIRWGYLLIPLLAMPLSGAMLLVAIYSKNPYVAVAALTLSFASLETTEGSYWAGTMRIAQADTMAATGVFNTGSNLGGVIGIPLVAYLSGHHAWNAAFISGFIVAVASGAVLLGVDPSRTLTLDAASDG